MRFGDWSRRRFVGGFINDLSEVERQVRGLRRSGVLSFDASQVEGDLIGNRIIAPTDASNTEPTDPNFSGWFLSAALQALTDGNFGLANVLLGAVRYGIGDEGEFIRGLDFLSNHYADVNGYYRRARRGYQNINDRPAYMLEHMDIATGTNRITSNPGFESGNLTGWTASDTYTSASWAASTTLPYAGSYCARLVTTIGTSGNATLTSDKYAVTAGIKYLFAAAIGYTLADSVQVDVLFYDATPTLIRTDNIFYAAGTQISAEWARKDAVLTAPEGSTQAEVRIYATFAPPYFKQSEIKVDAAEITTLPDYAYFRFEDNGVFAGDEAEEINLLGWPQSDLQFSDQYITSVTVAKTVDTSYMWGHYRGPSAVNASDGNEYKFQFTLAAGLYTMYVYGAANVDCGTVDFYLDGSATPFSTGQDWYVSGALVATEQSVVSVDIETGGRHTLLVKVNGKNASSTDYRWLNTAIWFVPADYSVRATSEDVTTVDYFRLLESGDYRLMEDGVSKRILG